MRIIDSAPYKLREIKAYISLFLLLSSLVLTSCGKNPNIDVLAATPTSTATLNLSTSTPMIAPTIEVTNAITTTESPKARIIEYRFAEMNKDDVLALFTQESCPDQGCHNNEYQTYSTDGRNVEVIKDGMAIVAKANGKQVESARLLLNEAIDFDKPGSLEIVAKFPQTDNSWSALWLVPVGYASIPDDKWKEIYQEIDIAEVVGLEGQIVFSSFHNHESMKVGKGPAFEGRYNGAVFNDFITYQLSWSGTEMIITIDNKVILRAPNPKGKFSVIMNQAVGGDWGTWEGAHPVVVSDYSAGSRFVIRSLKVGYN